MAVTINLFLSIAATAQQKPNIVLILVDDLGYGDVNLKIDGLDRFNNPSVITPRLASLAKESLVMTDHYSASPVCSPSRAGLLTGRTPTRSNVNLFIRDTQDDDTHLLHGSEITIPELLKEQGYQTGVFGKWHLNGQDWETPENWSGWSGSFPKQQGFDHGFVAKEDPHFTRQLKVNTQKHPGDFFTVDGEPMGPIKGYTSDIVTNYANEWMTEASKEDAPFFAFLSYDAVHIRIAAADRYEEHFNTGDARKDAWYANIMHLDDAIGNVLDHLKDLGIEDNTIVVFTSDNGPDVLRKSDATYFCYGTSYPLMGEKYQLLEGGMRVPGMVRWPKKIKPRLSDIPNSTMDLLPTFASIAGQSLPGDRKIDGVDLSGFWLKNKAPKRIDPMYWQFEFYRLYDSIIGEGYERRLQGERRDYTSKRKPRVTIREGNYVMIGIGDEQYEAPDQFQLYDIKKDEEQRYDISAKYPEVTERLKTKLLAMHQEISIDRIKTVNAIKNMEATIDFQTVLTTTE